MSASNVGQAATVTSRSKSSRWMMGDLIGRGAFASVYRATDAKSGEEVAIKRIRLSADEAPRDNAVDGATTTADLRARALKQLSGEVELLRTFAHPHIVRYLGTQRSSKDFYIVMEFVPGGSVTQRLHEAGRFNEAIALKYAGQMFRGLAYLHEKGVIHRDIKGANLLIDGVPQLSREDTAASTSAAASVANNTIERMRAHVAGSVKIADFGSARLLQHGATLEESVSTMHGTTYWMAPEVVRGDHYGRRCDVWSGGCVLLEMLSGRPPWHAKITAAGMNQFAAMFHIASSDEPPPMDEVSNVAVRELLLKCFARDARSRPSAADLLAEDSALLGDGGGSKLQPSPTTDGDALAEGLEALASASAAPTREKERQSERK